MTDLLGGNTSTTTPTASGGTFAGATSAPSSLATQLQNMNPGEFFAEYQISSTEQPLYITGGKLNQNATDLASFYQMSQTDRQTLEQGLVDAGLMAQTSATGIANNATAASAFKSAIGQASQQNLSVTNYLDQASQGGLAPIQQQIAGQVSASQDELDKQTPVAAQLENPTTLAAVLTAGFDQTLGYAPDPQQIQSFVSQIQGQDVANATAGVDATKAQAQEDLSAAQSAESALNKLGPDGIDTFLSSYANAVHGGGMPGAGTTQGPATSSLSEAGSGYLTPGSALPSNTNVGFNNSGTEMMANTQPSTSSRQVQNQPGEAGKLLSEYNPFAHANGPGTHTVATSTPTPGMATAPNLPPGIKGTTPLYGGIYALTPGLWQQAVAAYPGAKKYATAGAAPQSVQQAAVTALATNLYDKAGNWSDVAIELAGGKPGQAGTASGTKTNIQTFAEGVANDVNNAISSLQSRVNAPGPQITEKVTAPDATAEANLAAKSADPVGYYAANAATAGSLLNQMLAGAPQMYGETTADTFTGPVSAGAATTPTTQAA